MKRIILSTFALLVSLAVSAQTIKIYEYDENGKLSSTPAYTSKNKVKVKFTSSSDYLPVYWFGSNDILYEGTTPTTFAEAMNTNILSAPKTGFVPPVTTNYTNGYKLTGTTTSDLGWFIVPTNKVDKIKIVNDSNENIEDIFTSTAKVFKDKPEYSICEILFNTEFVNVGTSLYVYYTK